MQTLLLVLGATALTGLGLGFFFRVPALVVASAILATIACVTSVRAGSSVASAVLLTPGYLLVLQGSYLAGLIISGWARELGKRYGVRRMNRSTAPTGLVGDGGRGLLHQRTAQAHSHLADRQQSDASAH